MKNQNYFWVAVVVVAFAAFVAAFPLQEELLVEGVLSSVDLDARTLSIKTTGDQEMTLKYADDTKVVGQEENPLQSLKDRVGTQVKVSYKLVEEKPQAVRVEISQQGN